MPQIPRHTWSRTVGQCSFCSQRNEYVAVSSAFTLFCLDHFMAEVVEGGVDSTRHFLYLSSGGRNPEKFNLLSYCLVIFSSLHSPKHRLFQPALTQTNLDTDEPHSAQFPSPSVMWVCQQWLQDLFSWERHQKQTPRLASSFQLNLAAVLVRTKKKGVSVAGALTNHIGITRSPSQMAPQSMIQSICREHFGFDWAKQSSNIVQTRVDRQGTILHEISRISFVWNW